MPHAPGDQTEEGDDVQHREQDQADFPVQFRQNEGQVIHHGFAGGLTQGRGLAEFGGAVQLGIQLGNELGGIQFEHGGIVFTVPRM